MAVVTGFQVADSLCRDLDFDNQQVTFWSDSMSVLHYVRNPSLPLKTFVAHRVDVIHTLSNPEQWRQVDTQ